MSNVCHPGIGGVGRLLAAVVAVLMVPAVSVVADGFRNPPDGAAALGRGGARLTQGDDPAAVVHNPANLTDLDRPWIMPAVNVAYVETAYTSPMGATEKTRGDWRTLPGVFGAWPVGDDGIVLGLGLHLPYGQANKWNEDGLFRYAAPHYAEMATFNLTPAAACRFGERFAVGAGLDLPLSSIEFRQNLPWLPPPAGLNGPGSRMTFEGDGYAIGAHAGLTWGLTERQRLALVYRLPQSITYEGDFSMDPALPPGALPPVITPASDFEASMDFPTVIAAGYGLQATESLRVEVNVEWVEHSVNDRLDLDIDNNNLLLNLLAGSTSLPQKWNDTWVLDAGADWNVSESWTLRCGYTYLPTPVPGETLSSTLVEGDKSLFAAGAGYAAGAHRLDLAYVYALCEDREVSTNPNPGVNGSYEFDSHILSLSYALGF